MGFRVTLDSKFSLDCYSACKSRACVNVWGELCGLCVF